MANSDFSTLFDLLPIGAYRSSPQGRQLRANPALVRLDGYENEAQMLAATKNIAQEWYVDPLRRDQFKALLEAHDRVLGFVSEVYRHKTRERIWVRVHAHVVRDGQGQVLYYEGTVEDITSEHQARRALESSERRFRALTEKAQVLTVICSPQGILAYASPAAHSLLGVASATMLGTSVFDWQHPDDLAESKAELARALSFNNSGVESVNRWRHADGRWRYFASLVNNCLADDAVGGIVIHFRDVTEAHITMQKLLESEARFRSLTALSSDWYWELDANFRFVRLEVGKSGISPSLSQDVLGKTRQELGRSNVNDAGWAAHDALMRLHQPFHNFEFLSPGSEGEVVWHSISGEPMFDEEGVFTGYRGLGRDVTRRKQVEESIHQMAFHDPLTGLPNRRLLMDRLQQALRASERSRKKGVLLFLDLDKFKSLNDEFGHAVGDMLLQQVAQRLQACVRAIDTVARLGGDEFVVLLEDAGASREAATEQARTVSEKILSSLRRLYVIDQIEHQGSISIGATVLDNPAHSAERVLKQADSAMYQAKAAGRNTVCFYTGAD